MWTALIKKLWHFICSYNFCLRNNMLSSKSNPSLNLVIEKKIYKKKKNPLFIGNSLHILWYITKKEYQSYRVEDWPTRHVEKKWKFVNIFATYNQPDFPTSPSLCKIPP